MNGQGGRAELGLAVLLVMVAVALELFWLRPQLDRRELLTERRDELRALVLTSGVDVSPAANPGAAAVSDSTSGAPDSEIPAMGPIRVLEAAQNSSRLVQREVRRIGVRDRGTVLETSYYLEVYGSFRDAYAFMNELETGRGLVVVDRFRMVTAVADPGVTLFLWATVLTESGMS